MTSNFQIIPLLAWTLLFLLVGVIYALPMIIAAYRHDRHETAIDVLDLYGGWTGVGWLIALVWSLRDKVRRTDARPEIESQARAPPSRLACHHHHRHR